MQRPEHGQAAVSFNEQVQGVTFSNGKWEAFIYIDRKRVSLGRFDTEFDAACARLKAEQEYGWSCDEQDHNLKTILEELL